MRFRCRELSSIDYFDIHGISLEIITDQARVRSPLVKNLSFFSCARKPASPSRITFHIDRVNNFQALKSVFPDLSQPISSAGDLKYFLEGRMIYLTYPFMMLVVGDLDALTAHAYVHEEFLETSWNIFQYVFSPVFLELLKETGLFHIHAGAVSLNGKGMFFPGATGSGKTTLSLSLVRQGFSFLSDDISFVNRMSSGKVELLSFPQPVQCWQKTIGFFSELHGLLKKGNEIFKTAIPLEEAYPGSTISSTVPSVMILPKVNGTSTSSLTKIDRNEALLELIPQSIIVANREIVKEHLSLLTDLIYQCDCYRLFMGKDCNDLSEIIGSL
ncbi:MAG: hypothetical protein ACE5GM_11770 [bacterium]